MMMILKNFRLGGSWVCFSWFLWRDGVSLLEYYNAIRRAVCDKSCG